MIEWARSAAQVPYDVAVLEMERRAAAIAAGQARELVWLLEHPPLYTAGASADMRDILEPGRFPVFESSRGGQVTYHGPGQRVAYVMLDLSRRGRDIRRFVCSLEGWIIDSLASLGVTGERRSGRVGVWVTREEVSSGEPREDKIAAIGVRVRRWVSYHGISLNVSPDMSHFSGITPCGVSDPNLGVTSLQALGADASMDAVDQALRAAFPTHFAAVEDAAAPA
jgi:lipoyl(octanoyl) transferase